MEDLTQLAYAVDTFYFLVMGALVMFMAPGFAMLEAGMVRAKNTSEILTKNVALFSIACIMYMVIGYNLMYGGGMMLGPQKTQWTTCWRLAGTFITLLGRISFFR